MGTWSIPSKDPTMAMIRHGWDSTSMDSSRGHCLPYDVVITLNKRHSSSPEQCDLEAPFLSLPRFAFLCWVLEAHLTINTVRLCITVEHFGETTSVGDSFSGKMDSLDHLKGSNTLDQMMESEAIDQPEPQKQMWCERKEAAVHEEMRRMNQLPANSTYVTHRLKVLNKILQLMSVQRTRSQEEELELLFAGLSL
ncbi:hypothetical protein SESBI_33308 [Sesbania bispinosa]|nr:hypothetical protein SESBI_33308 [Sesbania bispinosa]